MFRLYKDTDGIAVRTARQYSRIEKALEVAKRIDAAWVEIRNILPSGKERLVDIVVGGRSATS